MFRGLTNRIKSAQDTLRNVTSSSQKKFDTLKEEGRALSPNEEEKILKYLQKHNASRAGSYVGVLWKPKAKKIENMFQGVFDFQTHFVSQSEVIIILTSDRLFFFAPGTAKLTQAVHFFEISRIISNDKAEMYIEAGKNFFFISYTDVDEFFEKLIFKWSQLCSVSFPLWVQPPNRRQNFQEKFSNSPCIGWNYLYQKACAYLKVNPQQDLMWDIDNIYNRNNVHVWDSETHIPSWESSAQKAFFFTLGFNSWFTEIDLHITSHKHTINQLGAALVTNDSIRKLKISSERPCDRSHANNLLNSIASNPKLPLSNLSLGVALDDTVFLNTIPNWISKTRHPVEEIQIIGSKLKPKSFLSFFSALQQATHHHKTIKKFGLWEKKNQYIDKNILHSLAILLGALTNMDYLNCNFFSKSNLNYAFWTHLRGHQHLSEWDCSNSVAVISPEQVVECCRITKVNLSNSEISAAQAEAVLKRGVHIQSLDLSKNALGLDGVNIILTLARNCNALKELIMLEIASYRASPIDEAIRLCFNGDVKNEVREVIPSSIEKFAFSSLFPNPNHPAGIYYSTLYFPALIQFLADNRTIKDLDLGRTIISENDQYTLIRALAVNTTLRRLVIDSSGWTPHTSSRLLHILEYNKSLASVIFWNLVVAGHSINLPQTTSSEVSAKAARNYLQPKVLCTEEPYKNFPPQLLNEILSRESQRHDAQPPVPQAEMSLHNDTPFPSRSSNVGPEGNRLPQDLYLQPQEQFFNNNNNNNYPNQNFNNSHQNFNSNNSPIPEHLRNSNNNNNNNHINQNFNSYGPPAPDQGQLYPFPFPQLPPFSSADDPRIGERSESDSESESKTDSDENSGTPSPPHDEPPPYSEFLSALPEEQQRRLNQTPDQIIDDLQRHLRH